MKILIPCQLNFVFRNRHLATSTDNFESSKIFVDKSLFIKEVIDYQDVVLITRPRRWGKSLNLQMLQTFLEVQVQRDELNRPISRTYFEGGILNDVEYRQLNIAHVKSMQNPRYYMENYQAKYPVVFINLKDVISDLGDENPRAKVESCLKYLIAEIFRRKFYLADWFTEEKKFEYLKEQFLEIAGRNKVDIVDSLPFLIEQLYYCYNKTQVYVLVDEYDRCINRLLSEIVSAKQEERPQMLKTIKIIASVITNFLSPLCKGNNKVRQVIITGIHDTLVKEDHSGVNNIRYSGINDSLFSLSFGFTKEEIEEQILEPMLDSQQNSAETKSELMRIMHNYYDGHTLPLPKGGQSQVYNAFSVMCFMDNLPSIQHTNKRLPYYWNKSGGNEILENLTSIKLDKEILNKLLLLAARYEVEFITNMWKIRKIDSFVSYENLNGMSVDSLVYILLNSGYITKGQRGPSYYRIPNQEVLEFFGEKVLPAWAFETGVNTHIENILSETFDVIASNLTEESRLLECLRNVLNRLPFGEKNENYFTCLIGGGVIMYNIYEPRKATHSILELPTVDCKERGRIGHIFFPIQNSSTVFIHEYKVAKTLEEIEQKIEEAQWQLFLKNYMANPLSRSGYFQSKFNKIEVRAVVFTLDKTGRIEDWNCEIKSFQFDLEEAKKVTDFFSNSETMEIIRKDQNIEYNKKLLLKRYNATNLEGLIKVLTHKSVQSTIISEIMLIEQPKDENVSNVSVKSMQKEIGDLLRKKGFSNGLLPPVINYVCNHGKEIRKGDSSVFNCEVMQIRGIGPKRSEILESLFDSIRKILEKHSC